MSDQDPSQPITITQTTTQTVGGFQDGRYTLTGGAGGFSVGIVNGTESRVLQVSALAPDDAAALSVLLSKLHLLAFAPPATPAP
jgi:hypothetical protein